jgi:hypothetical protein
MACQRSGANVKKRLGRTIVPRHWTGLPGNSRYVPPPLSTRTIWISVRV